jgi:hypothetical protein
MSGLLTIFGANNELAPSNPTQSANWIAQELGIKLQKSKESSIMEAIQSPKDYIGRRTIAIDASVAKAGGYFAAYQKQLLDIGVPSESAKALSLKYAGDIMNAEMAVWNMENPGLEQAFRGADLNGGYLRQENNMIVRETATQTGLPAPQGLTPSAAPIKYNVSKAEKRAIKDRALAKYKAKKRAKIAKIAAIV